MKIPSKLTASLLILLGFLSGCGTTEQPAASEKAPEVVRIATFSTAIDYSPYLVARSQKWFEESLSKFGATVEYTTFESLPSVNEALAANRVDAVFEAEPPAIIGKAAGLDIRIVAIEASLVQEIVVPPKSPVKAIKDLRGKKVAALAGTSSHYALLKLIRQAGLPDDSIKVIDMKPPDAKGAFETGSVEAWAVWPPWVEQELVAGKGRTLVGGDARIQSIMTVRGDFERKHAGEVCAITDTISRAKKWIQDNPAQAEKIVAAQLNLPENVVKLAWPQHDWGAQLSEPVKADIQEKANFLKAQGLIEKPVNVSAGFIEPPTCPVQPK